MTAPAAGRLFGDLMTVPLTAPYRRGAETIVLAFDPGTGPGPEQNLLAGLEAYEARHRAWGNDARFVAYLSQPNDGTAVLPAEVSLTFRFSWSPTDTDAPSPATCSGTATFPAGASALTSVAVMDSSQPPKPLSCLPPRGVTEAKVKVNGELLPVGFGCSLAVLLGNMAKLAWVVGWEKDRIRQLLREVRRARSIDHARGTSLDLIGRGLRVPRGMAAPVVAATPAPTDDDTYRRRLDDTYRRRLKISSSWVLPTRANIERLLDTLVPEKGFTVTEAPPNDAAAVSLRIVPARVAPGTHIDWKGDVEATEEMATGTTEGRSWFDPVFLEPVGPGPNIEIVTGVDARMVPRARRDLDALLEILAGEPGKLRLTAAYQDGATGLAGAGRALVISHTSVPADRLAALAHRAGFAFVHNRGSDVRVSCLAGDLLGLSAMSTAGTLAVDQPINVGDCITLTAHLAGSPATDRDIRWTLVASAAKEASKTRLDATNQPSHTRVLQVTKPGVVEVVVEYGYRGRVARAARRFEVVDNSPAPSTDTGRIRIVAAANANPLPDTLEVGDTVSLQAMKNPLPEELLWEIDRDGGAEGLIDHPTNTTVMFTATGPGWLSVRVTGIDPTTRPRSFKITPDTNRSPLSLEEYWVVMNALETFRPIGTEIDTRELVAATNLGGTPSVFPLFRT